MSAHILVPALDPDRPGTLSHRVLTGLLREELGYQGLIVTDGMEMRAISGTYGLEHGVVLAIAASTPTPSAWAADCATRAPCCG